MESINHMQCHPTSPSKIKSHEPWLKGTYRTEKVSENVWGIHDCSCPEGLCSGLGAQSGWMQGSSPAVSAASAAPALLLKLHMASGHQEDTASPLLLENPLLKLSYLILSPPSAPGPQHHRCGSVFASLDRIYTAAD